MTTKYLKKRGFTDNEIDEVEALVSLYEREMAGSPFLSHQECLNRVYLASDNFSNKLYASYVHTIRHKLILMKAAVAHGQKL